MMNNNIVNRIPFGTNIISAPKDCEKEGLFITSASYEERSRAVPSAFTSDYKCKNALIFYNEEFIGRGKTKSNLNFINKKLISIAERVDVIPTTLGSPTDIIRSIHERLNEDLIKFIGQTVTIDISTFPRSEILLLLRYITMLNTDGPIRVLYTRPSSYGKWLSKGCKAIYTVPSFGGTQIPGRKKLLIVLSGYEEERILNLIHEHEPSKIIYVINNPPTKNDFLMLNLSAIQNICKTEDIEKIDASGADPFVFCEQMHEVLNNYKREYNIFISPMGTKIQTVGLFLLFKKHPWFQITMASPNDYNVTGYSSGYDEFFEFYI